MKRNHEMFCHNPACTMFDRAQTYWYDPGNWYWPPEGEDPECRECYGEVHDRAAPIAEIADDAADWLSDDPTEWDATDLAFFQHAHTYAAHKQEQYRRRLTERSPA